MQLHCLIFQGTSLAHFTNLSCVTSCLLILGSSESLFRASQDQQKARERAPAVIAIAGADMFVVKWFPRINPRLHGCAFD